MIARDERIQNSSTYRLLKLLKLLVGIAAGLATVATALGWL